MCEVNTLYTEPPLEGSWELSSIDIPPSQPTFQNTPKLPNQNIFFKNIIFLKREIPNILSVSYNSPRRKSSLQGENVNVLHVEINVKFHQA
jgi:hypothetical protein